MSIWSLVFWAAVLIVAAIILKSMYSCLAHSIRVRSQTSTCRSIQKQKLDNQILEIGDMLNLGPKISSQLELKIIRSDIQGLTQMLDSKDVTSEELLCCYLGRCVEYGVKLNAIVDFNHKEAWETAKNCDKNRFTFAPGQRPILYGIPVSVKSNYIQKGFDTSLAMVQFYDKIHAEDGLLLQIIRESGAIPFVRTNLPVGVIGNENHNYIYGSVKSPWHKERTPGGSSGGESALVSSGCSPLGFTTDAAGSTRTPALFTGLYALMISPKRVTQIGTFGLGSKDRGFDAGTVGPIARSTNDLALATEALVSNEKMFTSDSRVKPKSWVPAQYHSTSPLKVGLLKEHKLFRWTKAQRRIVQDTVEALKSRGHEVVPFELDDWGDIVRSFLILAGNTVRDQLHLFDSNMIEGESKMICQSNKVPDCLIQGFKKTLECCCAQKYVRLREALKIAVKLDENELRQHVQSHIQLVKDVERQFRAQQLDSLIVPGLPVAYKHYTSHMLSATHGAHIFANSALLSAGVLPVGSLRMEEAEHTDAFDDMWTKRLKDTLEGGVGLPLGVQICSENGNDEKVLRTMRELEAVFGIKKIVEKSL